MYGLEEAVEGVAIVEDDAIVFEGELLAGEMNDEREHVSSTFSDRLPEYQKVLESLELEAAYQYFLNVVCRETGADFGSILLEREDRLRLGYSWERDGRAVAYREAPDLEQVDFLPKKVLRYAGRTYEPVFISSKPEEGPFAGDDYLKEKQAVSIFCLPLKYNDIFVGLIYLESVRNHRFDAVSVEGLARLSFHLVAKEVLERTSDAKNAMSDGPQPQIQLTEREREVLLYMAKGLSNREIAEKLNISSSTVKTHTLNLYSKLGVKSRVQAVNKAREQGLV